jgi:uncharacterized protein (TIGR03118 family)
VRDALLLIAPWRQAPAIVDRALLGMRRAQRGRPATLASAAAWHTLRNAHLCTDRNIDATEGLSMKLYGGIAHNMHPLLLTSACALALTACGGGSGQSGGQVSSGFSDTALVANSASVVTTQTTIDTNLSNPWGLVAAPGQPFWIADNHSNLATLYSGKGEIQTSQVTGSAEVGVAIPASAAGDPANATGQVYNGGGGFLVPTSKGQESAQFILAGEAGTLAGWAQDSGASAVTAYDDGLTSADDHAVYKGLALATLNGQSFLYATDLHNNKIDVFDTHFAKPASMQGKFVDPDLPAGFAPFGIAAIQGQLYVTYAMQDAARHDETTGAGLGYVDIFDASGKLLSRFASGDALNAPWGIALAPAGFGALAGDLLIGNFGDGQVNVFAPDATALATPMGPLTVTNGGTVTIPGLWALVFGNGDPDKPATTLYYTAGFSNQTSGVFGSISASIAPAPNPY